jgi:hypothetical protein
MLYLIILFTMNNNITLQSITNTDILLKHEKEYYYKTINDNWIEIYDFYIKQPKQPIIYSFESLLHDATELFKLEEIPSHKSILNNQIDEQISTVYEFWNNNNNKKYIGYTKLSLPNIIILSMCEHMKNNKCALNNIMDNDNINYASCFAKVLEIVKYNNVQQITSRRRKAINEIIKLLPTDFSDYKPIKSRSIKNENMAKIEYELMCEIIEDNNKNSLVNIYISKISYKRACNVYGKGKYSGYVHNIKLIDNIKNMELVNKINKFTPNKIKKIHNISASKKCIIYCIIHMDTQAIYIGSTKKKLATRLTSHFDMALSNKAFKNNKLYMHMKNNSFKNYYMYGLDHYYYGSHRHRLILEEYYINKFDSIKNGLNTIHAIQKNVIDMFPDPLDLNFYYQLINKHTIYKKNIMKNKKLIKNT